MVIAYSSTSNTRNFTVGSRRVDVFVKLWVVAMIVGSAAPARADSQIRVALACEETGRTKACPAFLQGFIDANPVLRNSPRAGADVIVYAAANEIALVDRMHLRFVGSVPGAPPVLEVDVDIDTRANDDA